MLWQKGKYEELEFNMSVHIKVNLRKENKQSQVHRQPEQTLVGDDLQRATYDKGTREQRLQASWEIVSDLLYFGYLAPITWDQALEAATAVLSM